MTLVHWRLIHMYVVPSSRKSNWQEIEENLE